MARQIYLVVCSMQQHGHWTLNLSTFTVELNSSSGFEFNKLYMNFFAAIRTPACESPGLCLQRMSYSSEPGSIRMGQ